LADDQDFVAECRKRLSAKEQALWDQRLQGRTWAEIAAEQETDPDVLRIRFTRMLERITRKMQSA
jgi:hypothetical protein